MSAKHCLLGVALIYQLAVLSCHCLLPSRSGSLWNASRLRRHSRWDDFLGSGLIHLFLVNHLIIYKLLVRFMPFFQLLHCSSLFVCLFCINSRLAFSLPLTNKTGVIRLFDHWCTYLTLDPMATSSCSFIFCFWLRIIE